jgi:hypothetical protein
VWLIVPPPFSGRQADWLIHGALDLPTGPVLTGRTDDAFRADLGGLVADVIVTNPTSEREQQWE